MRSMPRLRSMAALGGLTLLFPDAAWAHTAAGPTHGLVHGVLHPVLGADHLLAMVAVGLWARQLGGRALWALPTAFVATMALGAVAGAAGMGLPGVETIILLSVLALGVLTAAASRLPLVAAIAVVAVFALFHGHAHGTEMPGTISGLLYGAGFTLSTAALHAAGITLALAAQAGASPRRFHWDRLAGATIAAAGVVLWIV